jgi:aspartate/methionine/tyrosine aminotransferase
MKYNSLISELQPSASMKAGLNQDVGSFINLAVGLPELSPPKEVIKLIEEAGNNLKTKYIPSLGTNKARQNLIDSVMLEDDITIDNVSLSAGAKFGIYLSLYLLCQQGETVLLLEPYWVSYPEMCKILGLNVVYWKPEIVNNELVYDFEELTKIVEKNNISCAIINEPNNPSGHVYGFDFIEKCNSLFTNNNISLIIDEVYKDLIFEKQNRIKLSLDNIVRVGSLSKTLSLTGLRLGYVLSNSEFIQKFNLVNQHISTCISSIGNYVLEGIGNDCYQKFVTELNENYKRRRQIVKDILLDSKLSVIEGNSTFYLLVDFSKVFSSGNDAVKYLKEEHQIIAASGGSYGSKFSTYVRICTTLSNEEIAKTVKEIVKHINIKLREK